MNLAGTTLVVTGGAGFIGSHTVDQLLQHDPARVIVFDNFSRGSRENLSAALGDSRVSVWGTGADILHADILDDALRGADGVFHFAAFWLFHCQEFPRAAFRVNIEGTFNVLEACVRAGVRRLVLASSASVYGDPEHSPIDESQPFLNRTFYGATKISGEAMARAFHTRYGLDYVALRYMNVYGPRQHARDPHSGVVARMLAAIEDGQDLTVTGDGEQALDFVHVTDCARANVLAMQADVTDRCYNVGTGTGTSIEALARILLSRHPRAAGLGIRHAPAPPIPIRNRIGCTRAARDELGFSSAIGLDEGISALVAGVAGFPPARNPTLAAIGQLQ